MNDPLKMQGRRLFRVGTTALFLVAAAAAFYPPIRTPDGKTVWILGDHGVILRSSDGGTSWASQSSGLSASLLAGSAPSEMVCWVVGKQGSVLLTTDGGEHWQKIASPTSEDLIGVSARDAQNAAIWSDPSLPRYVTHDGGKNWQQSATN